MSWKLISEESPAFENDQDGLYFWLWDETFKETNLYFIGADMWPFIDPDFTHWMYDGESAEPPLSPWGS